MSIAHKIAFYFGIALIILVLALFGYNQYLDWRNRDLKQTNVELSADSSADYEYVKEYKIVVEQEKQANEAVQAAVERNPEWASEPLPGDVADLLRQHPDAAD
jgi:Na+/melibiose symporter-like transporter